MNPSDSSRAGSGSRPAPVRDKDDVSSAPESGDKPDAAGSRGGAEAGGAGGPQTGSGGRPAPIRERDDVSSAPESGDKPDAATPGGDRA